MTLIDRYSIRKMIIPRIAWMYDWLDFTEATLFLRGFNAVYPIYAQNLR